MKCKNCNGAGQEKIYDTLTNAYLLIKCAYCNGTGKIQQTNEEWFCQLSTEEKAEFLCNVGFENETIVRKFKSEWVEWLKEKYNG